MITRRLYPVIVAIGALALANCSDTQTEPMAEVDPLIFEIATTDGEVEGWLFGTIHALPDGAEWRTPAITRAIEDADYLLVEVGNLADRDGIADTFTMLATSPGQPALPSRVSPAYRDRLIAVMKEADRTSADFNATETWAAALILARVGATGDPANGVDRLLIEDFSSREVREFEGALGQLRIFDALAEEDQRDLLEGVIVEIEAARERPDRLRNAWLAGDAPALEDFTRSGIMADPEIRDALLVRRNRRWANDLVEALDDSERPLVAVGAGHLVGPDSLPAMLEERGYAINPLR